MSGITRNQLKSITYLMERFPIVAVLGARQVGKSTLLRQVSPNVKHFDLENEHHWDQIDADVGFFLKQNPAPITLDEAQLMPSLFNALRVAVDEQRDQCGQYLLSGSSSPELLKNISESLAGRVAIYELGGLALNEVYNNPPSSIYPDILAGGVEKLTSLPIKVEYDSLLDLCFNGGYPEHFLKRHDPIFHDQWMDNYFRAYIDRDVRALFPALNLVAYRRFIHMLAVSSGQLINASQFAKSLDVSQPTIKSYIEIAEGTFLFRQLPSYSVNLGKRLVKMPKGYIRDSGLTCRLLNINSQEQLLGHPQFGNIWESFIIEQLINGLKTQLRSFKYYFYRTHHQAEIDLVLEGAFGLIPIEIKSGTKVGAKQLTALKNFIQDYQCEYGIVINNSESVSMLSDKIIQIPAGCI